VKWIALADGTVFGSFEHRHETLDSIKTGDFSTDEFLLALQ
jgi:hypothetical protein